MPPFFAKEAWHMTIGQAIAQADELNRNTYSQEQKVTWLSRAEEYIKKTIINPGGSSEGKDEIDRLLEQSMSAGFNAAAAMDTGLIMPSPYDEAYVHYLQAQVYYANDETDRYNRAITMFNSAVDGFASYWKKTHTPPSKTRFRF